jgi:uncharacterized protein DUF6438/ankyrin repeat protein
MFRLILRIATVVVVAAVPVVAEPQAIPNDFVITLARSTCFGECPAYSVAIDAKGNVIYDGKKFVRVEGRQSDRVSLSRVAALAATVERIRFFELDERYRFIRTPDGGHISITDAPTTFVWLTSAGRSKSVEDYIGAPEDLKQLEKQIDETARTKRWITLDEPTLRQMVRAGWTPSAQERAELLRKAIQENDVSVIKALLESGADPNGAYYGTNMTPLMMVQSAAAARALLEAGANPSVRTARGVTPLMHAPHFALDLTEVLLKAGIPADQQDVDGRTPLLQASCLGNARVVKILLARGADPTRYTDSRSPLGCARDGKDYERLYPQRLIDIHPPFIKDFDTVIALLEQALAKRQRK